MVEHARRELDRLGEDPAMAACLTATVGAYASFGHSGGSHECALDLLVRLLRRRPLTALTADPAEWLDRSEISGTPLWQSDRDSCAFSDDGGRTYTLVDKPLDGRVVHTSVAPPGWVRALRERDQVDEDEAVAAVFAYLDRGPLDDADQAALDAAAEDEPEQRRYMRRRWGVQGAAVASLLYEPAVAPSILEPS